MMRYKFKSIWYVNGTNSIDFKKTENIHSYSQYSYSLNCDKRAAIAHLSLRYANTDFIHKIIEFIVHGNRGKSTIIHSMENFIYMKEVKHD